MSPLEELINRRWILKEDNVELYYQTKDAIKEIRKVVQEKFGYVITITPHLIKLEKIPGKAEPWMGIQMFQSIKEYQMFCYLLMFLEDKERGEQFVLSALTEYIKVQFEKGEIDWTDFTTRRQLIRVLKYSVDIQLIKQNDGNEDRFAQEIETEVLYENSGISRYMLRNFMQEVKQFKTPSDFEKSEWIDMDEDRGIIRRQRVYRRLLLSPGVYRTSTSDEDFQYIRNYRNQIQNDFQSFFSSNLHLHKSSAYLNLGEDCSLGKVFPFNNTMSDLILLIHHELRKRVKSGQYLLENQEQLNLSKDTFLRMATRCIQSKIAFLPKKYQEQGAVFVAEELLAQMVNYGFIEEGEDHIKIYPICGKISGEYLVKEANTNGK